MAVSFSPDRLGFGAYEIRLSTQELFKHGFRIRLAPQAFQVLQLLLKHPGQLVTREDFHRTLWTADTFVDFDHGLNNTIKKIRDALNDSAEAPRYIETLPRLGYRFIGQLNGTEATAAPAPPAPAVAIPAGSVWSRFRFPALVALFAIPVIPAVLFLRTPTPSPRLVRTKQLTSDGLDKLGAVVTDGIRVYFSENIDGHWRIASVPVSGGAVTAIPAPFPDACVVNISPSRSELLIAERGIGESPLWAISILGGAPRRLGNIIAHSASWSADGSKLAYTNGSEVFLARADGTEPRMLLAADPDSDIWSWSPAWSPDGKRLRFERYAMSRHSSQQLEMTADGRDLHLVLPPANNNLMQCCGTWTRDQKYYVFTTWRELEGGVPFAPASNISAIREDNGLFRPKPAPFELTNGPTHFFAGTLSPDDKAIFSMSTERRGELMRYDQKTGRLSAYLGGLSADSISFSPDKKSVAYVKYPQGELWRSRVDGSDLLQLTFRPLTTLQPQWSNDGKYIAFAGQTVGTRFQPFIVPSDGSSPPRAVWKEGVDPIFSPDGNTLLFERLEPNERPTMEFLDLKKGTISQVPGSEGLEAPRWSPDGKHISALRFAPNQIEQIWLFDFATQKWALQAKVSASWPSWSHDGRYVYFASGDADRSILRVSVEDNKVTRIVDLKGFRPADPSGKWFSLGLEDEPLIMRNTGGGTEIYALFWEPN